MLNDVTKKLRLLLVIAHPDDEMLWFFGGLKKLSEQHDITLYCLTYDENTIRGKELMTAASTLNLKCRFGNLEDTGITNCLHNLRSTFKEFLDACLFETPFDIIITHPIHGGEKPHLHHIQAFYAVRSECRIRNIAFGFFSERRLPLVEITKSEFKLTSQFMFSFDLFYFKLLLGSSKSKSKKFTEIACHIGESLKYLFKKNQLFILNRFFIRPTEKINILHNYPSQIHHLLKYRSVYDSVEYLYLEKMN